jgi:FixJ family two-component response regulator
MPEMNGLEVARQIRAIRPNLPILLASGFSSAMMPEDIREAGIFELIEKPASMAALAEAVRRALARSPTA